MPDHDWDRLQDLFHEAAELTTTQRGLFLAEACADRPDLRARVEAMVRALAEPTDPVAGSIEAAAREFEAQRLPSIVGSRLGAYHVVEEIGRGGMGAVYRAVRADGEYDAAVAVKVIRGAALDDALYRRFMAERRILAGLSHPGIASLLDAGTTADGLPYMVMELVEGTPITRFCDESRLTVHQRLRLFARVCEAVEFAHRNLVVHRDLKPSNILVTRTGAPKLVDFGVAKLLERGLGADITQTVATQAVLTPAYASPEQLAHEPITVATDVYGLGLVLYELLAGRRAQRFATRTPREIERVIRRADPPTLRTALHAAGADEAARHRATTPRKLERMLGGDVANVVMKTLRKEPERRYGSVAALARDVEAVLQGLPVTARPDTRTYRLRRFVGRNRLGVAAATGAALTVLGFATTVAVQNVETRRERDVAERRRAVAVEVSDFLASVFGAGPARVDDVITPEAVLSAGESRIAELSARPAVQAGLRDAVGRVYLDLGLTDAAERNLLAAAEQRRQLFGENDADYAASLAAVGSLRLAQGAYDRAASAFRRALEVQERALDATHPEVVGSRQALARVLAAQGDLDAADSLYRVTLAGGETEVPEMVVAEILASQAELLGERGMPTMALRLASRALEIRRRVLAEDHPDARFSALQVARFQPREGTTMLSAEPVRLHASPIPTPLEGLAGDFDGDGADELWWIHRSGGVSASYRSFDARGYTHPVTDPPVPWDRFHPVAGDFDGDGREDLALNARGYDNHVYVLFSKGVDAVEFGPLWTHPQRETLAPTWGAVELTVADLDGDGRDDLVWYQPRRTLVWLARSRGDGTFQAMEVFEWERSDRDLPNSLRGRAVDFTTFPSGDAPQVVVADLDGDGGAELVWSWLEDRNEVRRILWRDEAFRPDGPELRWERGYIFLRRGVWHYYRALSGDVDGDGRDDMIWVDPATPFPPADVGKRVYVGRSRSTPGRLDLTPSGGFQDGLLGGVADPLEVRTGDVNGDGRTDLVWNRRTRVGENRVWVTLGRADASFEPAGDPVLHRAGPDWTRATFLVADTDGDGRDEIVWNLPGAMNRLYTLRWNPGGGDGG